MIPCDRDSPTSPGGRNASGLLSPRAISTGGSESSDPGGRGVATQTVAVGLSSNVAWAFDVVARRFPKGRLKRRHLHSQRFSVRLETPAARAALAVTDDQKRNSPQKVALRWKVVLRVHQGGFDARRRDQKRFSLASVNTPKPAIRDHFKTGQRITAWTLDCGTLS